MLIHTDFHVYYLENVIANTLMSAELKSLKSSFTILIENSRILKNCDKGLKILFKNIKKDFEYRLQVTFGH